MEAVRAAAKTFLYANLYNSPGMEELTPTPPRSSRASSPHLMADPSLLPADHQAQIPTRAWPAPWPTTSPA